LLTHPRLKGINRLSLFLSPLSKDEITYLKAPERNISLQDLVTDIMRRKLLRRTRRQKGELSATDLENIEKCAGSAYSDMLQAWRFDHIKPRRRGRDHWDAFYYPLGDVWNSLKAFVASLEGGEPTDVEKWDAELLLSVS
jgi:guanylate kinase